MPCLFNISRPKGPVGKRTKEVESSNGVRLQAESRLEFKEYMSRRLHRGRFPDAVHPQFRKPGKVLGPPRILWIQELPLLEKTLTQVGLMNHKEPCGVFQN